MGCGLWVWWGRGVSVCCDLSVVVWVGSYVDGGSVGDGWWW